MARTWYMMVMMRERLFHTYAHLQINDFGRTVVGNFGIAKYYFFNNKLYLEIVLVDGRNKSIR